MNEIVNFIKQFIGIFKIWVIVAPWEQAARIRLGKYITPLASGIHLKLPFIDTVILESIRFRVSCNDRQTVTCRDGKSITFSVSIGYSIDNVITLYNTLHHGEDTIRNLVRSISSDYVASIVSGNFSMEELKRHVDTTLSLEKYGLSNVVIFVSDFAFVKAYRLIGDYTPGNYGTALALEATQQK